MSSALERLKARQAEKRQDSGNGSSAGGGLWGQGPAPSPHPPARQASARQGQASAATGGAAISSLAPPPSQRVVAYPKYSAATSHMQNDAYMDDFESALRAMGLTDATPSTALQSARPSGTRIPPSSNHPSSAALPAPRTDPLRARGAAPGGSGRVARGGVGASVGPFMSDDEPSRAVSGSWASGPSDPQGALIDLSERPLMCGAANWNDMECVIGGSDHALYVLDLQKGVKKRALFNKTYGHSEWVTACTYLEDGRIASVALDGKLMVWEKGVVKAATALAHAGSASTVQAVRPSNRLVTCGYDKLIKLWEPGRGPRGPAELCALSGHPAPVMTCRAQQSRGAVVSGDRSGNVGLWDVEGGACSAMHKGAHSGHVTCLAWGSDDFCGASSLFHSAVFASGGQDGLLKIWDPRVRGGEVLSLECHVTPKGRGAVGFALAVPSSGLVATAGADGSVLLMDPRMDFGEVHRARLTDFPYEMKAVGSYLLVGCGDGSLHVIDAAQCCTLYALGANRAAVRFIAAREGTLVAAGDDGTAIVYRF